MAIIDINLLARVLALMVCVVRARTLTFTQDYAWINDSFEASILFYFMTSSAFRQLLPVTSAMSSHQISTHSSE
eukprot:scaffold256443_cov15-Prasinocladus_malaysianus.AAC.1